jgi:hypothetical protein
VKTKNPLTGVFWQWASFAGLFWDQSHMAKPPPPRSGRMLLLHMIMGEFPLFPEKTDSEHRAMDFFLDGCTTMWYIESV